MSKNIKTNIDVSLFNHHFLLKTSEKKETKNAISKIYVQDFFSVNEINICEKIKEIPYYSNYFKILIDYDYIKFGQLGKKIIEKININDIENKKLLLFQYENVNNKYKYFNDFLFTLNSPKLIILHTLLSFEYLLNSLIKLNDTNICYFNLSSENILFYVNNPMLQNFRQSISISKLDENYIANIIKHTDDFTCKPLEVQVLFYLIKNNLDTISYGFIEQISEIYISNLSILRFFPENYIISFKNSCIETLKKYINKDKNAIISHIMKKYSTWDNYSISILYLHIFINISNVFLLKDTFINKLIDLLIKNIDPEPLKRESLETTLEKYNSLYEECNDWSFVNLISNDKIGELFYSL
jgi:hypothetical protein